MIAKVKFSIKGKDLSYNLDIEKLDRNYDDEKYAYWVVSDDAGVHEVNINKADDGSFKSSGTIYTWFTKAKFEDGRDPDTVTDVTYTFANDEGEEQDPLKEEVTVYCYGEAETTTRGDAITKYYNFSISCEGAERDRYLSILAQLLRGDAECYDE